jgi:hypothetical protein
MTSGQRHDARAPAVATVGIATLHALLDALTGGAEPQERDRLAGELEHLIGGARERSWPI